MVADAVQDHSSPRKQEAEKGVSCILGDEKEISRLLHFPTSEHFFSCSLSLVYDVLAAHTQTGHEVIHIPDSFSVCLERVFLI